MLYPRTLHNHCCENLKSNIVYINHSNHVLLCIKQKIQLMKIFIIVYFLKNWYYYFLLLISGLKYNINIYSIHSLLSSFGLWPNEGFKLSKLSLAITVLYKNEMCTKLY
jgi:hypothetical protein